MEIYKTENRSRVDYLWLCVKGEVKSSIVKVIHIEYRKLFLNYVINVL